MVSSLIDLFELSVLVANILRFYEFEIIELLQKRDIVVKKWQEEHQGINIYEDRNLVITSLTSISFEHKIKAVNKTIAVSA